MLKTQAIALFGTTHKDLAKAVGRSRSLISQWPGNLTQDQARMVLGAAMANGVTVPDHILASVKKEEFKVLLEPEIAAQLEKAALRAQVSSEHWIEQMLAGYFSHTFTGEARKAFLLG